MSTPLRAAILHELSLHRRGMEAATLASLVETLPLVVEAQIVDLLLPGERAFVVEPVEVDEVASEDYAEFAEQVSAVLADVVMPSGEPLREWHADVPGARHVTVLSGGNHRERDELFVELMRANAGQWFAFECDSPGAAAWLARKARHNLREPWVAPLMFVGFQKRNVSYLRYVEEVES